LKKEVSPGMIIAIVVVVVLAIGGIGYSMFFSKGGGVSSEQGASKEKEMQAKQAQMQQDQMAKHSGGGSR
jgi:flagellar basal body-associated protein FliL